MQNDEFRSQTKKIFLLSVLSISCVSLFFGLVGCTPKYSFVPAESSLASLATPSSLSISPPFSQIDAGSSLSLQASGGVPPYTYSEVSGGNGILTPSHDGKSLTFYSPISPQVFVIAVTDSAGTTKTAQIVTQDPNSPKGSLGGLVTNAVNGQPLAGVSVVVHADSDAGPVAASIATDNAGHYLFSSLPAGIYYVDFSISGFASILGVPVSIIAGQMTELNESMSSILNGNQIRIVLTWTGPKPGAVQDMDGYLQMPGYSQPIFFFNKTIIGSEYKVQQDKDNEHWYGPETITINAIDPGTYVYYVANYSSPNVPTALGNSNVHINVYQGSQQIRSYDVPPGSGTAYDVFHIVNGAIVDTGNYDSNLYHMHLAL